ncbi:UNVERIFIED_CONTAM: hypothetical protein HDU68_008333 [Siphonaria sp. JEL0065]|nr:hypothetical protein HDU68_008333 [Siphonaria sp. JEL0065]
MKQVEDILNDVQISLINYIDIQILKEYSTALQVIHKNILNASNTVWSILQQKYKSYGNNLYYGNANKDFIGLINYNTLYAQLPITNVNPTCALCQYTTQFTPKQQQWASTRGSFFKSLAYWAVYFQVRVMDKAPHFVIVNGAPRSDFMGKLDDLGTQLDVSLNSKVPIAIEIAVGVFVFTVAMACILTYYSVTRPLRFIIEIILQQDGNIMIEFAFMESTFFRMIGKFAEGLKQKKASANNSNKKATSNNTFAKSGTRAVSAASATRAISKVE